jgi:hypothetical protein
VVSKHFLAKIANQMLVNLGIEVHEIIIINKKKYLDNYKIHNF